MSLPRRSFRPSPPWLLLGLVLLVASLPYLQSLPRFGSGQSNDYFPTIDALAGGDGWSTRPSDWLLIRSNEHRVTVPALVYRLNVALTGGDNRTLSAWSLAMLSVAALALISMLPADLRSRRLPWLVVTATVAFFGLTPLAAENVAVGFSGTMWLTADALALSALALFARSADGDEPGRHFAAALALAVLAGWTYSTGLMVWPALAVLALLQGPGRSRRLRRAAWVAGLAAVMGALSLIGYGRPPHHPEPNLDGAAHLFDYLQVFLGGLFAWQPEAAQPWGRVGLCAVLVVFGLLPLRLGRHERQALLWPWLAVVVYALCNVVVIGIGRSAFGLRQALSLRYVSLMTWFWIGVLIPLLLVLFHAARRWTRPSRLATVAVASCVLLVLWADGAHRGRQVLRDSEQKASLHPATHLAVLHGIPDRRLIEMAQTPVPEQLWGMRETLRAIGHIPFDQPRGWPVGVLGVRRELDGRDGVLDGVFGIPGGWLRIQGWIPARRRSVAEIVLADAEGRVLGPAVYGTPRPGLVETLGEEVRFSGFMGFVRRSEIGPGVLPFAWVRFADDEAWYRLVVQKSVRRQWPNALAATAGPSALP